MIAEEVHDGCQGMTNVAGIIDRSAYMMRREDLPDHQWWRLFCSANVPPCCWAKNGFLNPGRRQCIGGGRELREFGPLLCPDCLFRIIGRICLDGPSLQTN